MPFTLSRDIRNIHRQNGWVTFPSTIPVQRCPMQYTYLTALFKNSLKCVKVHTCLSAHNLGVSLYECLTMESAVSQCGFFHHRNMAKSKCYFTEKSLLIVAHAFITNRMDYCNSLLFGLPKALLYKLQHLQNSTAKLIAGKHKYDHNTPELVKLHWLLLKERIYFKILLITFKCLNNLVPQ